MKRFLWLGMVVLLLQSCMSTQYYKKANSAFSRGDYPESARLVLLSLQQNPENQDSILLLEKAFPLAIEKLQQEITEWKQQDTDFRWSGIADAYAFIHDINDRYQSLPSLYHKKQDRSISVRVQYYHSEYGHARSKAAEEQYQAGLALENSESKEKLRMAVRFFEKADFYVSLYKDSLEKADALMLSASDVVLLLPQEKINLSVNKWPLEEDFFSDFRSELFQGAQDKKFMIMVDRSNLEEIMAEQKLSLSGATSSETMLKIGELSNADTLISYNISYIRFDDAEKDYWTETREILPDEEDPTSTYRSVDIQHWTSTSTLEVRGTYKIIRIESSEILDTRQLASAASDSVSWLQAKGDLDLLTEDEKQNIQIYPKNPLSYESLLEQAAYDLAREMAESVLNNFE